jgi:hypothetical protein
MTDGSYYGYMTPDPVCPTVQELPPQYCRSRFKVLGKPAVEFQMKFFDDFYKNPEQRMKILNIFPKEFKKGYIAYKEGNLPPEFAGD